MPLRPLAALALFCAALLAACGGGSGGGMPPTTSAYTPSPTPLPTGTAMASPTTTPAPTSTPTPTTMANVSGAVVDYASNAPLSEIPVAIAPWTPGATPSPVATTSASGAFSFIAAPGTYVLIVGSNSPTDARATLHEQIALVAGQNVLTAPTPMPEPDVTPVPSQIAGALRLMALSHDQQDCLSGANQGRSQLALPLLVPDEYMEEDAVAMGAEEVAQNSASPAPLSSSAQPYGNDQVIGIAMTLGIASCDAWSGPSYSYVKGDAPYPFATNPAAIWYGADYAPLGSAGAGAQLWAQGPGSSKAL